MFHTSLSSLGRLIPSKVGEVCSALVAFDDERRVQRRLLLLGVGRGDAWLDRCELRSSRKRPLGPFSRETGRARGSSLLLAGSIVRSDPGSPETKASDRVLLCVGLADTGTDENEGGGEDTDFALTRGDKVLDPKRTLL